MKDSIQGNPDVNEDSIEMALDDTPMLDAPDMWVTGSGRHLSPLQFFALTNQPRADLDGLSEEDVGLVEERCTRIDKKGVERFNQFWDSPQLDPYRTGDKDGPQRLLFIRYDRALAARGVLPNMELLVRDDEGRLVDRITLYRHGSPRAQLSVDDAMRTANAYLSSMLKKRSEAEGAYVRMHNGSALAEKLRADIEARRRCRSVARLPRCLLPRSSTRGAGTPGRTPSRR